MKITSYKKKLLQFVIQNYYFFTFAPMNKKQNNSYFSFSKNETYMAFQALLNRYFGLVGLFYFDGLRHSIINDDELQIIYANMRV